MSAAIFFAGMAVGMGVTLCALYFARGSHSTPRKPR